MSHAYRMCLAKEDFRFSVAHFTIFSASEAEQLHGHNYRIRVEVAGRDTDELGLLLDLRTVKTRIRELCSRLDSRTLLPTGCSLLEIEEGDGWLGVRFGDRTYRLPREGVELLGIVNTSIEELARYAWRHLAPSLAGSAATELAVEVEETDGQSCRYVADLEPW